MEDLINNNYVMAITSLQTDTDYIEQATLLSSLFANGLIESEEYNEQMMIISDKAWELM